MLMFDEHQTPSLTLLLLRMCSKIQKKLVKYFLGQSVTPVLEDWGKIKSKNYWWVL
jgi:hypothetical protein